MERKNQRANLVFYAVLLFTNFVVVGSIFYWGVLCAFLLRQKLPTGTLSIQSWVSFILPALVIGWGVFPFVVSQVKLVSPLEEYSTLWDDRHQSLLKASQNHESVVVTADLVKVDILYQFKDKLWLVGDLDANPEYWINRCAAQYYGVDQIIAR